MAGCSCSHPTPLVYACSGAADVGAIADQAARRLDREGFGNMSCLAGIGGRVPALMKSARNAPLIFAIDGCPQACWNNAWWSPGLTPKIKRISSFLSNSM